MMNDAPISLAPAVEQSPIGPCAKTTIVSPIRMLPDLAPLNPVEAIREKNNLFVAQFIRNPREIRLCVWNEEVFSLCAVDRVAETPTTNGFDAFAMAALRPLRGQACTTLSTRRDRAHEYPISDLVSIDAFAELFDHADGFVSN
jgi:hypothetical protein